MKTPLIITLIFLSAASTRAALKTQTVEYKAGDLTMKGYLAYDDAHVTAGKTAPGVLVFPEWWGLDDYPKKRAEMLAGLGYVAFAVDMYGDGKSTNDAKEAGAWAGSVKGDKALEKSRFEAALKTFLAQPQVDKIHVAAIGYCFGGSMALDMARDEQPLQAVVSFHGDLSTKMAMPRTIGTKILVCTGGDDAMVSPDAISDFQKSMKDAHASVKLIVYPGAKHAFTNPEADSHHMDAIAYNKQADTESWEAMKEFFKSVFGA